MKKLLALLIITGLFLTQTTKISAAEIVKSTSYSQDVSGEEGKLWYVSPAPPATRENDDVIWVWLSVPQEIINESGGRVKALRLTIHDHDEGGKFQIFGYKNGQSIDINDSGNPNPLIPGKACPTCDVKWPEEDIDTLGKDDQCGTGGNPPKTQRFHPDHASPSKDHVNCLNSHPVISGDEATSVPAKRILTKDGINYYRLNDPDRFVPSCNEQGCLIDQIAIKLKWDATEEKLPNMHYHIGSVDWVYEGPGGVPTNLRCTDLACVPTDAPQQTDYKMYFEWDGGTGSGLVFNITENSRSFDTKTGYFWNRWPTSGNDLSIVKSEFTGQAAAAGKPLILVPGTTYKAYVWDSNTNKSTNIATCALEWCPPTPPPGGGKLVSLSHFCNPSLQSKDVGGNWLAYTYNLNISSEATGGCPSTQTNLFISIMDGDTNATAIKTYLGTPDYVYDGEQGRGVGYIIQTVNSPGSTVNFTWNPSVLIGGNNRSINQLVNYLNTNGFNPYLAVGANVKYQCPGQPLAQIDWVGSDFQDSTAGHPAGKTELKPLSCMEAEDTPIKCNDECTPGPVGDAQCQDQANGGDPAFVCSASQGDKCRLRVNEPDPYCKPADYSIKCNAFCTSDAQCQDTTNDGNPNYICYQTADEGERCRLKNYEESEVCAPLSSAQISGNFYLTNSSDSCNKDSSVNLGTSEMSSDPAPKTGSIEFTNGGQGYAFATEQTGEYLINMKLGSDNSYLCASCNPGLGDARNCAKSGIAAGSTNADFYIYDAATSANPWWQVWGGLVYGHRNIYSDLPALNTPYLITAPNSNEKSAGIPITSLDDIIANIRGYLTQHPGNGNTPYALNSDMKTGQTTENFLYFSEKVDINGIHEISSESISSLPMGTVRGSGLGQALVSKRVGNLTVRPIDTITVTGKHIIFVTGNLKFEQGGTLEHLIEVPEGNFLAFVVSGNVIIDGTVGNTNKSDTTSNIEAVIVADGIITVDSGNKRCVAEGSYVGWSGIVFKRVFDDNADHLITPTELFIHRPDFVTNAPDILKATTMNWQEVN